MMPLDVVDENGNLHNWNTMQGWLKKLRSETAIKGIMIDVWWGLVEKQPRKYNWKPYRDLFNFCRDNNIAVSAVLSFHQCGSNVGDNVYIPLPEFVRKKRNILHRSIRMGKL